MRASIAGEIRSTLGNALHANAHTDTGTQEDSHIHPYTISHNTYPGVAAYEGTAPDRGTGIIFVRCCCDPPPPTFPHTKTHKAHAKHTKHPKHTSHTKHTKHNVHSANRTHKKHKAQRTKHPPFPTHAHTRTRTRTRTLSHRCLFGIWTLAMSLRLGSSTNPSSKSSKSSGQAWVRTSIHIANNKASDCEATQPHTIATHHIHTPQPHTTTTHRIHAPHPPHPHPTSAHPTHIPSHHIHTPPSMTMTMTMIDRQRSSSSNNFSNGDRYSGGSCYDEDNDDDDADDSACTSMPMYSAAELTALRDTRMRKLVR